jgi:D-hydroxyproline dehydrogenase subunit gamma
MSEPFFRKISASPALVTVWVQGAPVQVQSGETAAAAALLGGLIPTRRSLVGGDPRAPYCMMGVCFECLMVIDGVASRQACLVTVSQGMRIDRQEGADGWPG